MANDVKSYEVDLTKLTRQVAELRQKSDQLAKQQEALNRAYKEGKLTNEQYEGAMEKLNQQAEKNRSELQGMATTLEKNKNAVKDTAKATEEASAKMKLFGAAIGVIQGVFGSIANAFDNYRQRAEQFAKETVEMFKAVKESEEGLTEAINNQKKAIQERRDAQVLENGTREEGLAVLKRQEKEASAELAKTNKELEKQQKATKKALDDWNAIKDSAFNTERVFGGRTKAQVSEIYNEANKREKELINQQTEQQANVEKANEAVRKYEQETIDLNSKKQEEADKEKEKRQNELNEKKKKRDEERLQADKEAEKQLQDLRVQLIANESERQKAQILLNKRRAIDALNEIYKKASKEGQKQIAEAKNALESISLNEIWKVDGADFSNVFSKLKINLDNVITSVLADMEYLFKSSDDNTIELLDKLDNQLIQFTDGYINLLRMSAEERAKEFESLNNKELSQLEVYQEYLGKLYGSYEKLMEISPKLNKELAVESKLATGEINKTEASLEKENIKIQENEESTSNQIKAETNRYEELRRQIVSVYLLEKKRLDQLKEAGKISDKDYNQSLESANNQMHGTLAQLEENHQQSIVNIVSNSENQKTVIAQKGAEERKKIDDDEAEHRKQKIKEQTDAWISFAGAISNLMYGIADVYMATANDEKKSDEERDKAKKKALKMQEVAIGFNMAESLASGIAKAVESSSNWVEALVAIVAMVASVTSQFAQIRSLRAEAKNVGSYATGGLIGGETTNDTSDNLVANVSKGEYIVNSSATRNNLPLLDSINYGNNNALATQLALALQSQPSPVVSVEEINRVTTQRNQVSAYSHL